MGLKIVTGLRLAGWTAQVIADLKLLRGAYSDGEQCWFIKPYLDIINLGRGARCASLVEASCPTADGFVKLIHQKLVAFSSRPSTAEDKIEIQFLTALFKALEQIRVSISAPQIEKAFELIAQKLHEESSHPTKPTKTTREALVILSHITKQLIHDA